MQSLFSGGGDVCGPTYDLKQLASAVERDRSVLQAHIASGSSSNYGVGLPGNLPFRLAGALVVQPDVRLFHSVPLCLPTPPIQQSMRYDDRRFHASDLTSAYDGPTSGKGKGLAKPSAWGQEYANFQGSRTAADPHLTRPMSSDHPAGQNSPVSPLTNFIPYNLSESVILYHSGSQRNVFPRHGLQHQSYPLGYQTTHQSAYANSASSSALPPPPAVQALAEDWQEPGVWDEAEQQAARAVHDQNSVTFANLKGHVAHASSSEIPEQQLNPALRQELVQGFQAALTLRDNHDEPGEDNDWKYERDVMYPCFPTAHMEHAGPMFDQDQASMLSRGGFANNPPLERSRIADSHQAHTAVPPSETEEGDQLDFDQDTFAGFYGMVNHEATPVTGSATQSHQDMQTTGLNMSLSLMLDGLEMLDDALARRQREGGYTNNVDRHRDRLYPLPILGGLNVGSYPDEIVELEARLLQNGTDALAWFQLGQAQQANERDNLAIAAYVHCLSADPTHTQAYLGLAVSFTNEGKLSEAHRALETWLSLAGLPLAPGSAEHDNTLSRSDRHDALVDALLQRITIRDDPAILDLQVAFGILLNASEEYHKAADCFRYALELRSKDPRILNMLGATLANGGQPEQALECYRSALEVDPTHIRALFNSGVSYIKLSKFDTAMEFLLDALRLQSAGARQGLGVTPSTSNGTVPQSTSQNIWSTLESACLQSGRNDLLRPIRSRDLEACEAAMGS